jgi:two-component system cell cycle sensor histidine kinase/response regulator CckA
MAKNPTYEELQQKVAELEKESIKLKHTEEALRKSEKKYRLMTESTSDLIAITTFSLKPIYTYASPSHKAIMGYEPEELIGTSSFQVVHPHDKKKLLPLLKKYFHSKTKKLFSSTELDTYETIEYRVRDKSGSWHVLQSTVNVIENELLFISRDISKRIQFEEDLKRSEERYRILIEKSPIAIYYSDFKGKLLYGNRKTEELIGYKSNELTGKSFRELKVLDPQDIGKAAKLLTLNSLGRATGPDLFTLNRKDGSHVTVEISTEVITIGKERVVLGMVQDITERNRLEEQLLQAQKMESIGTLAGGIAHDFNNLLMGIQGNADLMLLDTDPNHLHHNRLQHIEKLVHSGADLTRQLLGFARKGKYEVQPIDINDLVDKTAGMFGRTKKEITVHTRYDNAVWPVEVDQSQIEQVLLNIYINAWQAMPEGGEIKLETENVTFDNDDAMAHFVEPGAFVKISITDTGVGMDKKTQQRIFDPFFTTKEMGRGTGLGMATAYGIIRNHGGIINVSSEEGKGTTFTIYLPASKQKVAEDETTSAQVLNGTETILFVDDEHMVRDVGQQILETLGYNVVTASGGKEALETFRQDINYIDMIILDMIMPHMSGGETYDRMKAINPTIRVLLSSGFSKDGHAKEILNRGCNGFIQKPFNIMELSQKIREVLDSR